VAADAQPSCSHSSRRKEEEARNGTLPPFGCFITTAFKDRSVPVRLHVSRIMLKNVEDFTGPRERSDLGFITFDITADLENIFDWNVKQLFLYLSAEYSTKNNALNQVVLWDKIVLRGDNPKLLLKDMKTKYFFFFCFYFLAFLFGKFY